MSTRFSGRTTVVFAHDNIVGLASFWFATWLTSDFQLDRYTAADVAVYSSIMLSAGSLVSGTTGAYRTVWRYQGLGSMVATGVRALSTAAMSYGAIFLYDRLVLLPRAAFPWFAMLLAVGWIGPRLLYGYWRDRRDRGAAGRRGPGKWPLLLVGAGPLGATVADWLQRYPGRSGWYPAGFLDDDIAVGRRVGRVPVLGKLSHARRVFALLRLRGELPRRILVTCDPADLDRKELRSLQEAAYAEGIPVSFADRLLGLPAATSRPPFPAIVPDLRPAQWLRLRSPLDRLAAALGLLFSAPLIAMAIPLVLCEVGLPAVFGQWRVGRDLVPFRLLKLRTMRDIVDEDGRVAPVNERLGRWGALIRRVRLDELIQLWNVLRGEMALIGPRPLVVADLLDMPEGGRARFLMRPGLTGWAQVCGGNTVTPDEKYALDLWYIAHASPALDLRILWRTAVMVCRGERRDEEAIGKALAWYRDHEAQPRRSAGVVVGETAA